MRLRSAELECAKSRDRRVKVSGKPKGRAVRVGARMAPPKALNPMSEHSPVDLASSEAISTNDEGQGMNDIVASMRQIQKAIDSMAKKMDVLEQNLMEEKTGRVQAEQCPKEETKRASIAMKALITRRINEAKEGKSERKEANPASPVNEKGTRPHVGVENASEEDESFLSPSTRRARQWELEDDKESSGVEEDSPTMSEMRFRQEEGVRRRERVEARKVKAEERALRCRQRGIAKEIHKVR
eukprot:GHVN01047818.1.p1 GENE.GHVN01047818.1~~GHVN01047818.1.p1  ORF type:complete len:242 (+),score=40.40 GHVN01047818.1:8-733(+)